MMKRCCRFIAGACLVASCIAQNTLASTILINPGSNLSSNNAALTAFQRAANGWGSLFSDQITVTINADLAALGPGILGSTSSVFLQTGYNTIRNRLVADAADEPGNAIVSSLPNLSQFSAFLPGSFSLNGAIAGTKANLKAMGFAGLDDAFGATDANIVFSNTFGFDFDNSDGVGAGLFDFETVAIHEIGHVLGFVSIVDAVDYYLIQNGGASLPLYPMDLFRFGNTVPTTDSFATTPRSLLPASSFFSDGVNQWALSSGRYSGDGRQASHWKDDSISGSHHGVMDPTLAPGETWGIAYPDVRVLDLIGWDVALQVPEPDIMLLFGFGFVGLFFSRRRRA